MIIFPMKSFKPVEILIIFFIFIYCNSTVPTRLDKH